MWAATRDTHGLRFTCRLGVYFLRFGKRSRLGQRHDLQNRTLTSIFYKNIYLKVAYVYFYENAFQNKSIDMIFTFVNLTT
jgi:hypothetical protein